MSCFRDSYDYLETCNSMFVISLISSLNPNGKYLVEAVTSLPKTRIMSQRPKLMLGSDRPYLLPWLIELLMEPPWLIPPDNRVLGFDPLWALSYN